MNGAIVCIYSIYCAKRKNSSSLNSGRETFQVTGNGRLCDKINGKRRAHARESSRPDSTAVFPCFARRLFYPVSGLLFRAGIFPARVGMKNTFLPPVRAVRRYRTWVLLAALAVVCAAGYEASGGRFLLPAEAPPSWYYEAVTQVFEPFFTPSSQPGGETWMVSSRTPDRFPSVKPPGTVRVFIVGGSVADLWHDPDVAQLGDALSAAWPSLRFEVVNCGVSGYDSSRERRVLAEVLGYRPDLVVLLSGNNQFRTRLSRWRHALFRVNRQLRRVRLFRLLQDGLLRMRGESSDGVSMTGMLDGFDRDMRWMLHACRSRGVAVLPVALPANLRDYAPHSTMQEWKAPVFGHVRELLDRRRFVAMVRLLSPVVARENAPAIAWYWMGRAFDGLRRDGEARAAYTEALERDPWKWSAWPSLNARLRGVALEMNTGLIGLDEAFAAMDSRHMPGMCQFRDNCHWNRGYYRVLALLVAGECWKNRARYPFLPEVGEAVRPPAPLDMPVPPKTSGDVEDTLESLLHFLAQNPGNPGCERDISLLEGLAREGFFSAPCSLSFHLRKWHQTDWMSRDEETRAAGLDWCWPAFMLLETEACLRAGRLQDARGWLARAVKMRPAFRQSSEALRLRALLLRTPADAARWRARQGQTWANGVPDWGGSQGGMK